MKNISKNFIFYGNYSKRAIYGAVISLLLSFFSFTGQQIEETGTITPGFLDIISFFGYLIIYFVIVYSSFYLFETIGFKEKRINLNDYGIYFISFGILSVIYFILLLGVFPGIFAFDSNTQFLMYEYKKISEHHPVIHTLLLGYIVDNYSYMGNYNIGAFIYSILQILIMSLGFSFVSLYTYKRLKNFIPWILSLIFYAVYPPILLQVLSATKDSLFLSFMMITIVLSLIMIDYSKRFFDNKIVIFVWVISFVLMTILRNNCMYAIPFLLIGLILTVKKYKKQTLIVIAIALALFFVYKIAFVPSIVYKKVDDREKLSVLVQQLNRIYNSPNANITEEEKIFMEDLLSDGVDYYYPKISDYTKAYMDIDYYNEHKSEVFKTYIKIVSKNPKIAAESFLENTEGFYFPYSALALYPDGKGGYWPVSCWEPWYFDSKIPSVLDFFGIFGESDFILYNPVAKTLFYPGSLFYLFVIMFGYAVYKKKTSFVVVFLYTLMLLGTYFLGPVALVRYAIYLYTFVPLYLCMLKENKENNNHT